MAYQGIQPAELAGKVSNIQIIDDISSSFDGSTTTFALTSSGVVFHPITARSIIVVLGGIIQEPEVDYTVEGQNLTFTTAPVAGLTFACRNVYGLNFINGVNDGVVTPAKLSTGGPSWTTTGRLKLGTNEELQIYYDGGRGYIKNGVGQLRVKAASSMLFMYENEAGTQTESYATFSQNGGVQLFYDGTKKFETTTGGVDVTGAVNIDSTTSNTPLVVEASQNNRSRIVFRNDTETGTECNIELIDEDLRFVTNSGERIRITRDGKIGIGGVTDPKTSLHLADGDMSLANNDFIGFNLYYDSGWKQIASGTTAAVKHHNVDGLQLYAGADSGNGADGAALAGPRMTIKHDGDVGIGTTNPIDKLTVENGSDDNIILRVNGLDASSEYAAIGVGAGYAAFVAGGAGTTNTDLVLMTSPNGVETEQIRVTTEGELFQHGTQMRSPLHIAWVQLSGSTSTDSVGSFVTWETVSYTPKRAGSLVVCHMGVQTWNGSATDMNGDIYFRAQYDNGTGTWQNVDLGGNNNRLTGNFDADNRRQHLYYTHTFGFYANNTSTHQIRLQASNTNALATNFNWIHTGDNCNHIWFIEYDS